MPKNFINDYYSLMTDFFNKKQQTLNYNDRSAINQVFENLYNDNLNILFGYYEVLRKNKSKIEAQYYVYDDGVDSLNSKRRNVYNFEYYSLPMHKKVKLIDKDFVDLIVESLENETRTFNKYADVPKSFQFSNYFDTKKGSNSKSNIRLENIISDFYTHTYIQKSVCQNYPYYVVLNEEIYFFIYLYIFFNNDSLIKDYVGYLKNTDNHYGLKQLVKFTISVCEATSAGEEYSRELLQLLNTKNLQEIGYREVINQIKDFDDFSIDSFIELMNKISNDFIINFKEHLKKNKALSSNKISNSEIVFRYSRFHIKPYLHLIKNKIDFIPDFFVFPIFNNFKNSKENLLQTKNLPLKTNELINLNNPVLFSCFIKPLYQITKEQGLEIQYDETKESMEGFVITKILAKELAAPVIQSEFFGPQILNLVYPQAIKSSLAAVMSRNMSHNIGSHVLNKLSSAAAINDFFKLGSSKRFVKGIEIDNDDPSKNRKKFRFPNPELPKNPDDSLRNLEDIEAQPKTDISVDEYNKILKDHPDYLERFTFSTFEGEKDITFEGEKDIYKLSPYFVDVNNNTTKEELARVFNDYLKKRMDFVADVATSNKALLNSNKYLFADIFRGFERNLLLLHNISGKEDKFSYQFQFQYDDGEETHNYYECDNDGKPLLNDVGVPIKNNNFIDPIVAVPNDVLGSQAFYIILENIIRNTAKHSGSGNVIFTIKVEDLKEDDFYRITVFDNAPHTSIKKLVADRNVSIAQEVLDENNQIRTAGWGTIEIKLAACYLSGLDMLEMDNKVYWPIGYDAYTTAKEKANKTVNDPDKLEKIKKKYGDDWVSEQRYVELTATTAYIDFINQTDNEIVEKNKEYPKDFPQAKKRVYLKDKNEVVRYPIVQAVDGNEKDATSGFGYSFLMKKPKKLLIIDEADSLKFSEKEKELTALKRLGIDIIKAPNRDSIYNHQFMIIVGDGHLKEITVDENGNKTIPYYGDWFNLPQERLLYLNGKTYNNFIYNLKSNFFQIINNSFEDNTLISCLKFVLGESIKRKYQVLDRFLELRNNAFIHKQDELNLEVLLPDTIRPFDFGYPKSENNSNALFRHHGLQKKVFYNENTKYAEIYGSVTQLGLLAESIENQFKGKGKDIKASLKKEYKNFYEIAANSSVIVIDERIQSSLNEIGCTTESIKIKDGENEIIEDGYQILNKDIFLKTKIYVPNKDFDSVDLNCSDLKTQKKPLELYIKEISAKVEADYMIIHFGIIEGLRETSKNESVNTILEEIKDWLKSDKCKIVITSGRGYTPDIKSLNQYFVAYSTISNLLLDPNGRSKGHLMQCLKQLRKLKN